MAADKRRTTKAPQKEDGLVPIRVPRSLKKRIKALGNEEDKTLQVMAAELLEEILKLREA